MACQNCQKGKENKDVWHGEFPSTLTLPITTVYDETTEKEPKHLVNQLIQGNTFSINFDMKQAAHSVDEKGSVLIKAHKTENFQLLSEMVLTNMGIEDACAYVGFDGKCIIFDEKYDIRQLALWGEPREDGIKAFKWKISMMIDKHSQKLDDILLITNGETKDNPEIYQDYDAKNKNHNNNHNKNNDNNNNNNSKNKNSNSGSNTDKYNDFENLERNEENRRKRRKYIRNLKLEKTQSPTLKSY